MELAHPANSSSISDLVARQTFPPEGPRAPVAWVPKGATAMSERNRQRRGTPSGARRSSKAPALSQCGSHPQPDRKCRTRSCSRRTRPTAVGSSSRRGKPDRPPRPDAPPLIEGTKRPPQKPNLSIHHLRRPQAAAQASAESGPPRARGLSRRQPKLTPRPQKPRAAPRPPAATPTLTSPTTPTTAAAAISPELGLGLEQALSAELAGHSHRLLEAGSASAQQMASARSVPELIEIQARQLQALSDAWLEHTSRISEIDLSAVGPGRRR